MPALDLNRVRELMLQGQEQHLPVPIRHQDKVFVDSEGTIRTGDQVAPSEARFQSEVHRGVFASLPRLTSDITTAVLKLPSDTKPLTVDGVIGWAYKVQSSMGDRYRLFTYHDGSLYQTLVVSPDVAGRYGVHDAHLYSDGRICLSNEGGLRKLDGAFAKSCLWAEGFSFVRRGYPFPFSANQ